MAIALEERTYLPDPADSVAEVFDFVQRHEQVRGSLPASTYYLTGADVGDRVELPKELFEILRQAIDTLRTGRAVTIAPVDMTLTTQQAADLLGVSRPTLVRVLDQGKLPFEKINSHRRLRLIDVLSYRDVRRQEQYAALDAIYSDDTPIDAQALEDLSLARATLAARRKSRRV